MPGPSAILKELHRLRRHCEDLDTRIGEAPRKMTVQQKRLANQEETARLAHDHLKNLALQIRDKEGSVKATQAQIKKYEKQLEESANKKEYETLKSEIASERTQIAKHEDEILQLMAETEERTAQLPAVDKQLTQARADFAKFEKDQAEKLQQFAADKARTAAELKAAEATLPVEVRPQYERMITGKGMDALSGVRGRICSACYTEVTSQMLSELKLEMFMMCKNCGRMLYVET